MPEEGVAALVGRAVAGDEGAWRTLVHGYCRLVWGVAREHRLTEADAADVSQTVWLLLSEHLGALREPASITSWLVTTARRECLRLLAARRSRQQRALLAEPVTDPQEEVLRDARDAVLWRAVNTLPQRCRLLLRLVAHHPELTYAELAGAVGLATGSVGPTKTRCLAELRRRVLAAGLTEEAG